MKCDRCNGRRYIEPRDGKRLDCPKCDGSGILFGARLTDPDGRLTTEEYWPGFNYNWTENSGSRAMKHSARDWRIRSNAAPRVMPDRCQPRQLFFFSF
jgi:hypothetical protein